MKAIKLVNKGIKFNEPFKSLYTQGMVCHETYKDESGKWLSPDEIIIKENGKCLKIKDRSNVVIGASEAMSKSKKNTIDPETMIKKYGSDSVRLFVLSDSPPDKDIQWSDTGINASYKFLQRVWNLNLSVEKRDDPKEIEREAENAFKIKMNGYLFKVTNLIEDFNLNVVIANMHEIYHLFNENFKLKISNSLMRESMINFMKILLPIAPHLCLECLEKLKVKDYNKWPEIDKKNISNKTIKIAVQINGKTREIIEVNIDIEQQELNKIIKNNDKIRKFIFEKKIKKEIFVKNKIINYVI